MQDGAHFTATQLVRAGISKNCFKSRSVFVFTLYNTTVENGTTRRRTLSCAYSSTTSSARTGQRLNPGLRDEKLSSYNLIVCKSDSERDILRTCPLPCSQLWKSGIKNVIAGSFNILLYSLFTFILPFDAV
jgi:hypothetical protein